MKAGRHDNGSLQLLDLPMPEPGIEHERGRICAAGVCHSDLHLMRGDWRRGALSELGDIFDELESGKDLGRAVITDLWR
jgi:hypothetical protein